MCLHDDEGHTRTRKAPLMACADVVLGTDSLYIHIHMTHSLSAIDAHGHIVPGTPLALNLPSPTLLNVPSPSCLMYRPPAA